MTTAKITAAITAVGKYVPDYILTNKELESLVDTSDEWITTRTGIKERRILKEPEQGASFMAIRAAKNLISKADINPEEIDMVLVATATPDMPVASTAVAALRGRGGGRERGLMRLTSGWGGTAARLGSGAGLTHCARLALAAGAVRTLGLC